MNSKLTEYEQWIQTILVIIDTQEKKIDHITNVLDLCSVKYEFKKLASGDYTYLYPDKLGNYCQSNIIIERKNSIDEITQNFGKYRDRFKREFSRLTGFDKHIIIENNVLTDIFNNGYKADMHPNSLIMSVLSFQNRYNIKFHFIRKLFMGHMLLRLFYANYKYLILEK